MDHQAFAQLLGNYGEFLGAIAVVVTLVYLTIQIRQNTNMMRAETRSIITQNTVSIFNSLDVEAYAIFLRGAAGDLEASSPEYLFFQGKMNSWLRTYENEYFQFEQGLFGQDLLETRQVIWASLVSAPGVQLVWQASRNSYAPTFRRVIDQMVSDSDGSGWSRWSLPSEDA